MIAVPVTPSNAKAECHEKWSQPRSPAVGEVFGTPELLEMILLGLPIRHILASAERVCRSWKATIDGSIKLQRALFFQPLPYGPLYLIESMKRPKVYRWG
jgi:hypothetical protein